MTPELARLAAELERHLGLNPAAVGERLLRRAVAARQAITGAVTVADYLLRLTDAERAELVEEVVVPETWFLRYPESFRHLADWAKGRATPGRPLRALSVPCSTGEEAYSVALTLLDAGLPPAGVRVVGADVSRRSAAAARAGVYPDAAFRDAAGRAARDRHFDRTPTGWAVRPAVRQVVTVHTGNLTAADFLADEAPFDAVFCRNLFIYLTPAARLAATANLLRLLAPGGVVYMGHAEPLGLADDRFRPVPPPQAFAFERAPQRIAARSASEDRTPTPIMTPLAVRALSSLALRATNPEPADPLAAARVAADRNDPRAAAELVERHLAAAGPSADAFALLGVVRGMAGDPAAAEAAFTRALFLDPGHPDALLHRLAQAEGRGDAAAAANFRRRLARPRAAR
jgi:chemotaxis protein methyltransferase WspC